MSYNKECKLEAAKFVTEKGRSLASVANDLGVSSKTLYNWIDEYNKHAETPFQIPGNSEPKTKKCAN